MVNNKPRRTTTSKQAQSTLSECKLKINQIEQELSDRDYKIKHLNETIQKCKDSVITIKGCANLNKPMYRTPSGAIKALEAINDNALDMLAMLVERDVRYINRKR
jgi:hypothetical protein